MPNAPRLIIFDCDGVLIDSEILATRIEADALTEEGFEITPDEVSARFIGRPADEMYAAVEEELGRKLPDDFEDRIDEKIMAAFRSDLEAVEGVAQTIPKLDLPICVASSSRPNKLLLGLVETRLLEHFYPNVFSTVLVEKGKPEPDIFLYAARQMGEDPAASLVVEDSPHGVAAGLAAGMQVVGFTGGRHTKNGHGDDLKDAGAHHVIERFTDLPDLLASLAR